MSANFRRILRNFYVLNGLLLSYSALECSCHNDRKRPTTICATFGDSLYVIDKLVFKEKRFTYAELVEILKNNF